MPQFPIGRYGAWVTLRGLSLTGTINNYSLRMELTAQEAVDLLQLLYDSRDTLFRALHPELCMGEYPCPSCEGPSQLVCIPAGYAGSCRDCGNGFTLDMSGVLTHSHYGQAR